MVGKKPSQGAWWEGGGWDLNGSEGAKSLQGFHDAGFSKIINVGVLYFFCFFEASSLPTRTRSSFVREGKIQRFWQ